MIRVERGRAASTFYIQVSVHYMCDGRDTDGEVGIRLLMVVKSLLDHERQHLSHVVTVCSLVCPRVTATCKIRSPPTTTFGRRGGPGRFMRLERTKWWMVGWQIISDVRELIESHANVYNLQRREVHSCIAEYKE